MSEEIHFKTRGPIGIATLDRPRTLNTLNQPMVRTLRPQLAAWAADPAIKAVVVEGAGERAFCAGGDVVTLRRSIVEDNGGEPSELSKTFFFEEYQLNHEIHTYRKPYIALIDGVTMGGGVGLSVHGGFRVATERTMVAMPETTIGLFPDVGGGWFLPRCPGESGTYLALTGDRLDAAGALALGAATHMVPSDRLPDVMAALEAADWSGETSGDASAVVDGILKDHAGDVTAKWSHDDDREILDRCFAFDTMKEIVDALAADPSPFAAHALEEIRGKSPTSLAITLEQLRRGRAAGTMAEVMTMEYRMSQHCAAGHDFMEGVRALLVDKDRAPKWSPATIEALDQAAVLSHFDPIEGRELTFD